MPDTTLHLQLCLDRLRVGDETARADLLNAACRRLARLARKMLKTNDRLRRWEESGDVVQNAMLRLYRALQNVTPGSLLEFFRLAALQIRRELADLARRHSRRGGLGAEHAGRPPPQDGETPSPGDSDPPDLRHEPSRLAVWSEFHEQIGALPEAEREVVDLVWYQGLTHSEAAGILNVSTRTVQRRWQAACLRLHEAMHGDLPGL
jgi:RNA polymerase sigma-70 factor (ECF subfamily)